MVASSASVAEQAILTCQERIEQIAAEIPDAEKIPESARTMEMSEQHLRGVLAALDAARIADEMGENQHCNQLVNAAMGMLSAGGYSTDFE